MIRWRTLGRLAIQQARLFERKPYSYWVAREHDFPINGRKMVNLPGKGPVEIQIEITLYELNTEYVQMGVSVEDGWISAYCPPTCSIVIRAETG